MTAGAHTTAARPGARRHRTSGTGPAARLPWWALLLPALAFVLLISLIAGAGGADAAERRAAEHSLTQPLEAVPPVLAELWGKAEQALLG